MSTLDTLTRTWAALVVFGLVVLLLCDVVPAYWPKRLKRRPR